MDPHYTEWLNLLVRWVHMIVGIAWIGASFYFVWLENNLNRKNPKEGLSGDLWAIHGGGIYHLQKYKLAPKKMPEHLHWFKWEAYATFLSGITLLAIVYYLNAQLYLLAPGSDLTPMQGIGISIASLVAGWFIYDFLCDSALGKRPALLGVVLLVLLVAAAWALSQVFSGRAAYIHIGAITGTMMVGNVFRVIMPGQRNLVAAIKEGRDPDPAAPAKAMLRSRHNNYLTLPVLFIMISNHFPSTYGSEWNWAILFAVAMLSVLVRHYFNTRHESQKWVWTLPASALGMLALAFVTKPAPMQANTTGAEEITLAQVTSIVNERCTSCHAANPTSEMFSAPPAGVILESSEDVILNAARIHSQSVATQAMPLGNLTGMLPEERVMIGKWFDLQAASAKN
ncbi:MAG: urate hydroxylase PuuD [Oceanospirillaceae bacterium]|nr:urate hydroxylase PuuD [Oceanospirillaceae bacterium]